MDEEAYNYPFLPNNDQAVQVGTHYGTCCKDMKQEEAPLCAHRIHVVGKVCKPVHTKRIEA